jgi:hypothetical protein
MFWGIAKILHFWILLPAQISFVERQVINADAY